MLDVVPPFELMPSPFCCIKSLHVVHHHRRLYMNEKENPRLLVISLWSVSKPKTKTEIRLKAKQMCCNWKFINLKFVNVWSKKKTGKFKVIFKRFCVRVREMFMLKSLSYFVQNSPYHVYAIRYTVYLRENREKLIYFCQVPYTSSENFRRK